jgi:hypothetical protein
MQFTEQEIKFLLRPHKLETAAVGSRPLAAAIDLRTIGCPPAIFNGVLERRARQLGPKFAEFRSQQAPLESATENDLNAKIQVAKLW